VPAYLSDICNLKAGKGILLKNLKKAEDQSINNKLKKFLHYRKIYFHADRIPFLALSKKRASMTVEASIVLPIFLMAMVLITYIGLLIECQDEVQWALTRVAREASAEYGATESKVLKSSLYYQTKLSAYLEASGLSFLMLESNILEENDEIDLVVTYRAELPFRLFPISTPWFRQRVHTRAFTGVETRENATENHEQMVYVTETGQEYHKSNKCTYLKLSISQMKFEDIEKLRNESGGKYKPCERCCKGKNYNLEKAVWITNYGDRYHVNEGCSGIRRSIEKIKLSEIGKRTPCSKCKGE